MKSFTFWRAIKNQVKMQSMKKIFLLLLMFAIACNKDSSNSTQTGTGPGLETTTPAISPPSPPPTTPTPSTPTNPVTNQTWTEEFMDLVNDHRSTLGLRALIHDDEMAEIARSHSHNMASGTVAFGHTGFSSRCTASKSALGGGNWCAENVAAGQSTPKSAFTSWLNSSGHRANIEQARATHTGFGYARSSSGKYYWTQIFVEL